MSHSLTLSHNLQLQLILPIAFSVQHDGEEYVRLLTFCKRVCVFFNKCSDSGLDPFMDIHAACASRIKVFKSSRFVGAMQQL